MRPRRATGDLTTGDGAGQGRAQPDGATVTVSSAAVLAGEQPPLALDSPAVTGGRAIGPDHAMAGDDDRCVVRRTGAGDGAHGGRLADRGRQLRVRSSLAEGNRLQSSPHTKLKRGAVKIERHGGIPSRPVDLSHDRSHPRGDRLVVTYDLRRPELRCELARERRVIVAK